MEEGDEMAMTQESKLLKCFLVCPIGEEGSKTRIRSDYVKRYIVEPALEGLYEVVRADQMRTYGRIDDQIIRSVLESDLVIVDFTDNNPNVYFEFGMRFTLANKPFLCICNKKQTNFLPFDVQQLNVIGLPMDIGEYDEDIMRLRDDERNAREKLRDLAMSLHGDPNRFVSPVADQARTVSQLAESGKDSGTLKMILDKLSRLGNTMEAVERSIQLSSMTVEQPQSDYGDLLSQGERFYREKNYDRAAGILQPLVEREPENMPALYYLGYSLFGAGKLPEARRVFEQVYRIRPDFKWAKDAIEMINEKIVC